MYLTYRTKCYFSLCFFNLCQTIVLSLLMRSIGNKNTILLGLGFQILQLAWYGFGSEPWYVHFTLVSEKYGIFLHFILYPREALQCVYMRTYISTCRHRAVTWSLCFAGWCGRPALSQPCPVSRSQRWARWFHALQTLTSKVGFVLVLRVLLREHCEDRCGTELPRTWA